MTSFWAERYARNNTCSQRCRSRLALGVSAASGGDGDDDDYDETDSDEGYHYKDHDGIHPSVLSHVRKPSLLSLQGDRKLLFYFGLYL